MNTQKSCKIISASFDSQWGMHFTAETSEGYIFLGSYVGHELNAPFQELTAQEIKDLKECAPIEYEKLCDLNPIDED